MPVCNYADREVHRGKRKSPPDETITLTLDHQETQAIINALHESNALGGKLVFDCVLRLNNKVDSAMRDAGWRDR
jgi:hypothetical protein